jgi:hypothetical protein
MADGAGTPYSADEGYFSPQQADRIGFNAAADALWRQGCRCPWGRVARGGRHDENCQLAIEQALGLAAASGDDAAPSQGQNHSPAEGGR